jgi:hypothetical protein
MSLDRFGITKLFESTGRIWESKWDNGHARSWLSKGTDKRNSDPDDIECDLHCKAKEGKTVTKASVDGKGILNLIGVTPRIYINDPARKLKWFNVESTVYFYIVKKLAKGGAYVACRLCGRSNHQNEYNCSASGTGYSYETKNSNGTNQARKEIGHPVYSDNVISNISGVKAKKWIGHKLIVKSQPDGSVLVQGWRDLLDGLNGGDWKLMVEKIDRGDWPLTGKVELADYKKIKSCKDFVKIPTITSILNEPAISCYLRCDNNQMMFKRFSIREI